MDRLRAGVIEHLDVIDRRYLRVSAITGADPLPYGVDANRAMINQLIQHAVDQHILDEAPSVESLFA